MSKSSSGFTLLELVVTLGILSLISAITIPNFLHWLPRYRVRRAAGDLLVNMQLARLEAVKQHQDCIMTFSKNPDQYSIDLLNKNILLSDYKSGIEFEGPDGKTFPSSGKIVFNSVGNTDVGAGYAYLTNENDDLYLRVGALTSGVIRQQTYVGSSWE